jgi:hypothetical protein
MRTKLNLNGSNRRAAERLGLSGVPTPMPMEWLDAGNWRLPSGQALAEFALRAGFLAPPLFKAERFGRETSLPGSALPSRAKHFGKGSSR